MANYAGDCSPYEFSVSVEDVIFKLENDASARVSNFESKTRKVIMNAFISSQFNYCPLLWMLRSRSINSKINKVHHRA